MQSACLTKVDSRSRSKVKNKHILCFLSALYYHLNDWKDFKINWHKYLAWGANVQSACLTLVGSW